jgi:pimeloyl-ACP methyl ester carboxylesterase
MADNRGLRGADVAPTPRRDGPSGGTPHQIDTVYGVTVPDQPQSATLMTLLRLANLGVLLLSLTTMTSSTAHAQAEATGHYAKVNGITMYYEIHGSGEPLVLIHGGGSTIQTSFGKLMPLLAKTRRVIAVELQAHGHTSDRNAPESFEQDADDVAELLRQLGVRKADVLGFSNGGSTALQVAIRHPQQVNKLVAISAIYRRDGMQPWFWDFMARGSFEDMPQVYKDAYLRINPDPAALLNMHDKDRARMMGFTDWKASDLEAITAPALIVVSDRDVVRPEHALEMVHLLPNGRLAVFLGGHGEFFGEVMSPHPESRVPELFAAMVEEFLAASETSAPPTAP